MPLEEILGRLEEYYGPQTPGWPTDPWEFLVWWHAGYPQSDANCGAGWAALRAVIPIEPAAILEAGTEKLTVALRAGGMVPDLRAQRLREVAARVRDEFGGDLRGALEGPVAKARQRLKKFPGIADPGADRILLFGGVEPLAAVPSNCPHVLVRIRRGPERLNYGANYKEAQAEIAAGTEASFAARTRAYLLVKCHGQTLCKTKNPRCGECPVSGSCRFAIRAGSA